MSLILGLIVGGVEVVYTTLQTGLHDGEVLVRESDIDDELRAVAAEELAEFRHAVGVDAVGRNSCAGLGGHLFGNDVALGLGARRENDLTEHIGMLGALVGDDCPHASGADDHDFSHYFISFF